MHLEKFIHSHTGKVLSSIILGIGLVSLFKATCKGKNCIINMAPPDIENNIYKHDNKCYTYTTNTVKCNKS